MDCPADPVYLRAELVAAYEPPHLGLDELRRHPERLRHCRDLQRLVRLQVLVVRLHAQLLDEVREVPREPDVAAHALLHFGERIEELGVVEVVKREKLVDRFARCAHLHCAVDLGAEVRAIKREDGEENCAVNKVFVVHELGGCEGRERGDEEVAGGDEVAADAHVEAFVDFEAVLALPIAAFLDQRLGLVKKLFEGDMVIVEEGNAHLAEYNVELLAKCNRMRE